MPLSGWDKNDLEQCRLTNRLCMSNMKDSNLVMGAILCPLSRSADIFLRVGCIACSMLNVECVTDYRLT